MLGKNHGFLSGEDLSFNQAIDPLTRGIICIIIASWRYDIIQQKLLLNPQIGHDHNESSGQKKHHWHKIRGWSGKVGGVFPVELSSVVFFTP